jgi:hypothetical protein
MTQPKVYGAIDLMEQADGIMSAIQDHVDLSSLGTALAAEVQEWRRNYFLHCKEFQGVKVMIEKRS